MIRLSDRLKAIAKEIKNGESMADIGTDHGLLPMYLWENSISPEVILSDINEGPLEKAKANSKRLCGGFEFDMRRGSGIETLDYDEVYAVVIAGMGGILISDILNHDLEKSKSFRKLILQPRNKKGYLRYFLLNNGFEIKREKLVREGDFICSILTVEPRDSAGVLPPELENEPAGSMAWEIPVNINRKNALYEEFLVNMYNKEVRIFQNMSISEDPEGQGIANQIDRVRYMKTILNRERFFYDDFEV